MMRRFFRKDQSGVTLIELLVVMLIMAIVSTMILGTWFALSKAYANATQSAEQRDNAQMAMERLTRELRDAQAAPANVLDSSAISSGDLGPASVRFNTTFNMAAAADPATTPQLLRYRLVGESLYRELAGPDRRFDTADDQQYVVVDHVVNTAKNADLFEYYYYDGTGDLKRSTGTTDLPTNTTRIKAIKITLFADLQPGHPPEAMKIVNVVQLRNQRNF
jgi:prepilin-type N-terminal cleavage/methylation domain-containing protein